MAGPGLHSGDMTTPPYPQYPGQEPGGSAPARPKSVDTSFMLWLVSAALGILGTLISFATVDDLTRDQLGAEMEGAVAAGVGIGAFIGLAIFVAWIAIVFQMRNGKNWARIVLAVLGGLSILFGLLGLFGLGELFAVGLLGVLQGLLSLAQLAVVIGAMVFMFKPDASRYFQSA